MAENEYHFDATGAGYPGGKPSAQVPMLNTPRSKLAMQRCGILHEELNLKRFQDFYIPGDNAEKQRLRFSHYEKKRQVKIAQVLKERANAIFEEQKKKKMPAAAQRRAYQSLQAMEQLLDKEASRLEHELKQQLKYHQTLEKGNVEQLDREAKMRETLALNADKKKQAQVLAKQKANEAKRTTAVRRKTIDETLKKIDEKKEAKLVTCLAEILETEVRLQKFNQAKAEKGRESSDAHHKKLDDMAEKLKFMEEERIREGDMMLQKKHEQIDDLNRRRTADREKKELEMVEMQLKINDVLERKKRMGLAQDYRLKLVKEESMKSNVRIETMIQLKDQMIAQRKIRLHAPNKFKAVNLRNFPTGPGQYEVDRDRVLNEVPVTKISVAGIEKGHVEFADQAAARTKDIPPPGTYDPKILPDGNRVEDCIGTSVHFTKGKFENFAEVAARYTRANPGPGQYNAKNMTFHPTIGAKMKPMVQPRLDSEPPAWCEAHLSCTPGPNAYSVDKFMRQQDIKTAQQGMPTLAKAMKLNPTTIFL